MGLRRGKTLLLLFLLFSLTIVVDGSYTLDHGASASSPPTMAGKIERIRSLTVNDLVRSFEAVTSRMPDPDEPSGWVAMLCKPRFYTPANDLARAILWQFSEDDPRALFEPYVGGDGFPENGVFRDAKIQAELKKILDKMKPELIKALQEPQ